MKINIQMMNFWFLVLIAGAGITNPLQSPSNDASMLNAPLTDEEHKTEFDSEVKQFCEQLNLPGCVVVVARDGELIHQLEFGYSNLDSKTPVTVENLFWVASVTKTFTAMLIMQLVEQGLISLDDRMIKYLSPSFFPSRLTPDISIRNVLGHTSQGTPGRTFVYHGGRYNFVFGLFEKIANVPFNEYLINHIIKPVGLKSTMPGIGAGPYQHLRSRVVTPYRYNVNEKKHILAQDVFGYTDVYPATGLLSSALDLVRYAKALDENEVITAESHKEMISPAISKDGYELPYGVGWFSQKYQDLQLVWHYGYGTADSALLLRVPEQKLTLIVLSNSDLMSASTSLGNGNVLTSSIAVSFLKHFVLRQYTTFDAPLYHSNPDQIRERLTQLKHENAHSIYADELFAQIVIQDYMAQHLNGDAQKPAQLLKILLDLFPERFQQPDITMLELLSQQDEKNFYPAALTLLNKLLEVQPENPGVYMSGIKLSGKMNRNDEILKLYQQLYDLPGYEDDQRKLDAAIWLGEYYAERDSDRAARYLWDAMNFWFNSGNGDQSIRSRITDKLDTILN